MIEQVQSFESLILILGKVRRIKDSFFTFAAWHGTVHWAYCDSESLYLLWLVFWFPNHLNLPLYLEKGPLNWGETHKKANEKNIVIAQWKLFFKILGLVLYLLCNLNSCLTLDALHKFTHSSIQHIRHLTVYKYKLVLGIKLYRKICSIL